MALEKAAFDELRKIVQGAKTPIKLLSLGYPDLLLHEMDILKAGVKAQPPVVKDSEQIARWHSWQGEIFDTDFVFKKMGIDATYVDIHASRGIEKVLDLNTQTINDTYDIVLDLGTLEHVFNIGTAWRNVWNLVQEDGYIIHNNPINMINHGFWNLSPTAYYDFYRDNGGEILVFQGMVGPTRERKLLELPKTERVQATVEITSLVVVKKMAVKQVWPTQSKYLKNSELKA